jgi:SAM-dependent methyltransferase
MTSVFADLEAEIEGYYSARLAKYGAKPLGVDWSCLATQRLRFVQLLRICDFSAPLSINDLGCGYGALLDYIAERHSAAELDYLGIDVSPSMIRRARRRYGGRPRAHFVIGGLPLRLADYSIASGIMNVKLDNPHAIWEPYVERLLRGMYQSSRRGFAVNFMAELASPGSGGQLYRTNPEIWLRYCRNELGCAAEVKGDYGMREFTLLITREKTGS